MQRFIITASICLGFTVSSWASAPTTQHWTIDNVDRQAVVYAPDKAKTDPAPLVFAFHGHGGNVKLYSSLVFFPKAWPEAIIVYPQGLNTPGLLTDHTGKAPGWQTGPGEQDDRDLKFFDAMLASLEKVYKVDPNRIYVTGHSNGGTFTYILWETRSQEIAAFAPVSCSLSMTTKDPEAVEIKVPDVAMRPIFHVGGKNDPVVKIAWQMNGIEKLRNVNHCGPGEPYDERATLYPSTAGAPVITWIHNGNHASPPHAAEEIVKFFKQYPRSTTQPSGIQD
jgi:polyhydroxybutyrate depolymerase